MGIGFAVVEKPMSHDVLSHHCPCLWYFATSICVPQLFNWSGSRLLYNRSWLKANGVICDIDFSNCPTINSLDVFKEWCRKILRNIFLHRFKTVLVVLPCCTYCWCAAYSRWVFNNSNSASNCASNCANNCGNNAQNNAALRSGLFGSVGPLGKGNKLFTRKKFCQPAGTKCIKRFSDMMKHICFDAFHIKVGWYNQCYCYENK